ncbi:MAG: redoxin domain-containing protein [Pirellulales bacterium]
MPTFFGATLLAADVGAKIERFSLPDIHGRDRSLDQLADKPIVVVAFLGVECPLTRLYAPRLQELSDQYASKNVAIIGIDANQQDSLTDMAAFARQYGVKFPLLKDRDQRVAEQFGVIRNPEVFVLDKDRKLRYRGRIDDQYGRGSSSGYAKTQVKSRDLANALDELLAGKEVSQPTTTASGCIIGRQAKIAPKGEVTYAKHIATLLEKNCVGCHRPGQVGPFALMAYEEVAGWGEMIKEVVTEGRMPPWSANPEFGHFANDARLSDAEKQLIFDWVDNGCPQGDTADLPKPRQWIEGWKIGEPQQVVRMKETFKVPAEGVIPYKMFYVDPQWTEDKWIQAAEVLPSNRGVVHHIIAAIMPPGGRGIGGEDGEGGGGSDSARAASDQQPRVRAARRRRALPTGDDFGGSKLTSYVPGRPPTMYPPGIAMFAPAGSKLMLQIHYTPNGRETEDQSYIGLIYADPKTVKKRAHVLGVSGYEIAIPPYADNYKVQGEMPIHKDQILLSMSPHMHLRGKSFRYEAVLPDGTSEILVDVPKYDFNWQLTYELAKPKLLPAGSKLVCTAYYDNSENNAANPDPSVTVNWGPQTWDEMMIGYYATVTVEDDAHKATAAAPPAQAAQEDK